MVTLSNYNFIQMVTLSNYSLPAFTGMYAFSVYYYLSKVWKKGKSDS